MRNELKKIAAHFGITSMQPLWEPIAIRAYRRKLKRDPEFRAWYEKHKEAWIKDHWAHEQVTNEFVLFHLASQIYEICKVLKSRLGPLGNATVLDAGASDGMYLSQVGAKQGVGVNLLPQCIAKIQSDGFKAVQASVEKLPFDDKSFDYLICFETLEHVPNPIHTIDELVRVGKQKIFITIPWMPHTRINAKPTQGPEIEGHIFEFDEQDFSKILTYTKGRMLYRQLIQVFPEPKNPFSQWLLSRFMYPWFFPKLQYYELTPSS
jgi:SAM-dependent methyltransferase